MNHEESAHGRALLRWCYLVRKRHPELDPAGPLFHHIPNGGARNPREGQRLKEEGVKRGIPDYFLAVPRGPFHGLYLELKRPGGRLTPEQFNATNALRDQGYAVHVCYGAADAREKLTEYLQWGTVHDGTGRHAISRAVG